MVVSGAVVSRTAAGRLTVVRPIGRRDLREEMNYRALVAMRRISLVFLWTAIWLSVLPATAQQDDGSLRTLFSQLAPRDPQSALESFRLSEGFRMELVCAEPLVSDPIAIDWGPDGRLWVVEMGDYPGGGSSPNVGASRQAAGDDSIHDRATTRWTQGSAPVSELQRSGVAGGRIRILEDTDRDGQYDKSTVFLDGLSFPTGVMVWRRGVLVTCAPEIFYAEDMDGDGKADRRETLFDGFVEGNPQHRVNGLRWGIDNWIYGANGDSGGIVRSVHSGQLVDIHARDFRFRPETGVFETQTGMSQYGRCRDDWGNWFGGRNLQPVWHCALDDQYLRRNRLLAPPDPCIDLMDPPTSPPVYPISTPLPRFNEFWTLNRFTAACGISIYRDELFGADYANSVFVCEPTYNLVHRSVLEPRRTTFACRRGPKELESEFVSSTDHWFRPVQTRTGPDGALWIVDMYRLVIEHPDYIPEIWHQELDFHAGRGRGRIYRVLPEGVSARRPRPLADLATAELVRDLDDPNGPRRDMIQQLLIHSGDRRVVPQLRALVLSDRRPQTRLSALGTLDGLDAVDPALLLQVLDDSHPALRRHAIRLAEPLLNDRRDVQAALAGLITDADPQVRMQLAYTLGAWDDPRSGELLARIAVLEADDPLMIAAVMSSATQYPGRMLDKVLEDRVPTDAQIALVENLLRLALEDNRLAALTLGLERISAQHEGRYQRWQFALLAGLIDAIEYQGESFREFYLRAPQHLQRAIASTSGMFRQALVDANDMTLDARLRVQAIRLIGRDPNELSRGPTDIVKLLSPQSPLAIQVAVVNALARIEPSTLPTMLLERWTQHGPEIRPRIVDVLLSRQDWAAALLDAVAQGQVAANELGASGRNRLILHNSSRIRRQAAELLRASTAEERLKTIEQFRDRLDGPADIDRGRIVFRKHCATCHRLENEGTNIGPDLLTLTDRSPDTLLLAILDPDRAVEPRYVQYSLLTLRGHVLAGIVAHETGNSLTLIDAQGVEHKLVRSDVDELVSTGKSLMPFGVEKLLSDEDELLDLIAYIRSVQPDPAEGRRRDR
jgi:putative membrane-bound dehydrogenase-like protein